MIIDVDNGNAEKSPLDEEFDHDSGLGMLRGVIDPRDEKGLKNLIIDRIHWRALQEKIKGAGRLLDFGCGTGRFAKRISDMGIHYTGIDKSANMISKAREHNMPLNVDFIHYDGTRLPFHDSSFDVCISVWVMQYLIKGAEIEGLLHEIKRVLAPNSRFILIEQASMTGQTSGNLMRPATENDYKSVLSGSFDVELTSRIRSHEFLTFTKFAMRMSAHATWMFRLLLDRLAVAETRRANSSDESYFRALKYYDILICARSKITR